MGSKNFRDAYEYDPETYDGEAGGLDGMMRRYIEQQRLQQQGGDVGSPSSGLPDYSSRNSFNPQGGLLGRLQSLYAEQGGFQPTLENGGQTPLVSPPGPNYGQLLRVSNGAPLPMSASPTPQTQAQYEADQAQQAREAAAARLARGVRSLTRAETQRDFFNADPVDIAKSTGIGLVKGTINLAGLPGNVLTGFGYLPNNAVINGLRYSDFPYAYDTPDVLTNEPDWIRDRFTPEPIQHWLESITGEFYQPKSRGGRYAETIGEMAPAILGGAAGSVLRGGQVAAAALRELPGTLLKHAVAPGVAVQALEETLPDSKAGETLQKTYPVARRALPAALAAKRYLGRRIVPQ